MIVRSIPVSTLFKCNKMLNKANMNHDSGERGGGGVSYVSVQAQEEVESCEVTFQDTKKNITRVQGTRIKYS